MTKTDVSGANFKEAQFSKGYLRDSNFDGADFTNAIVDRATFKGSSLKGAIFQNAVLTATSFEGADVEGADFTDAYIGDFDIRNLCRNPTLSVSFDWWDRWRILAPQRQLICVCACVLYHMS